MKRYLWWIAGTGVVAIILIGIIGQPALVVWAVLSLVGFTITSTQFWMSTRILRAIRGVAGPAVVGQAVENRMTQALIGLAQSIMVALALIVATGSETEAAQRVVIWGLVSLPGVLAALSLYINHKAEKLIATQRQLSAAQRRQR